MNKSPPGTRLFPVTEEVRKVAIAFGQALRDLRLQKGLSRLELAARCNFTDNYPAALERGARGPSLAMIYRVSQALAVNPTLLVTKTRENFDPAYQVQRASAPTLPNLDDVNKSLAHTMAEFEIIYYAMNDNEEAQWVGLAIERLRRIRELCDRAEVDIDRYVDFHGLSGGARHG